MTDGPFVEGKEHIGGFWIIEAADLDAALEWAAQATVACGAPVEVRPFQEVPRADGGCRRSDRGRDRTCLQDRVRPGRGRAGPGVR